MGIAFYDSHFGNTHQKKDPMEKELIKSDYETMIFTFRGKKVMVDSDLALLYDVPTKVLKQQVKRNTMRFPEDSLKISCLNFPQMKRMNWSQIVTGCHF
jgi:hypothetical protein